MANGRPVIDQRAAEQMNLNVLRRIDPQIEELLATAGHVALYDFDIPSKRWSRKDVEGSLFLVKRRSQPRFQFVILNKKSAVATDNFVEVVHGGFQCEVQKPYVLYRNRVNEVVGIWFYDDADCDRISALLQRIASTFAAPADADAGTVALVTPAEDDSAAAAAGGNSLASASGGDDAFWDRRVTVPDEVPLGSSGQQALLTHGQPGPLLPAQPQQQQSAMSTSETAPAGSNDLARLFAGIKVGTAVSAAPLPTVSAATAAAPALLAAAPAAVPMQLLTPQLLQQETAVPAIDSAPVEALACEATAESILLQNLLRGSAQQHQHQQPPAAPPATKPQLHTVDISEAADRVLRSKVSSLLKSLAGNDAFCSAVAAELKRAGLV